MPREFTRSDRVSDAIQRLLGQVIPNEIRDPRIGMVNINEVTVTRDMAYAKVYVTFLGLEADKVKQNLDILNDASGFIRSLIAKRIQARIVPTVRFYFDKSLDEGIRMANLVENVRKSDEQKRVAAGQELDPRPDAKTKSDEEE